MGTRSFRARIDERASESYSFVVGRVRQEAGHQRSSARMNPYGEAALNAPLRADRSLPQV
jgi:hypothetical protein